MRLTELLTLLRRIILEFGESQHWQQASASFCAYINHAWQLKAVETPAATAELARKVIEDYSANTSRTKLLLVIDGIDVCAARPLICVMLAAALLGGRFGGADAVVAAKAVEECAVHHQLQ